MNQPVDAERILDAYLAPDGDRLADRVLESAFAEIACTPQGQRVRLRWAYPVVQQLDRLATVALVGVVAVWGALYVMDTRVASPGDPSASPPPSSPAPPTPTPTPEPTADPTPTPPVAPDMVSWTSYESPVYSYVAAYPEAWKVDHFASRSWDAEADGLRANSRAVDTFRNKAGTVTVSRWQASHDPEDSPGNPAMMLAWVEELCQILGDTGCDGVAERAISLCPGDYCNAAFVVPFRDHVLAFYVGTPTDTVNVVALWLPETDPALADYGGAANLLRAFIERD